MFPLLVTITRVLGAIWRGLRDPAFRHVMVGLVLTLISGTVFYSAVEGWPVVDSVYFCVMTLSTVGYGDLHPTSSLSKVFTVVFLFVGAGLFVSFITKLTAQRKPYHLPVRRHHQDEDPT